jgi:hypothetical protein
VTTTKARTGRTTRRAVNSDWQADAACRQTDPELFFPEGRSQRAEAQRQQAKTVCAACPVRSDCLSWALESGQYLGVLGGLDEDERWERRRPGFGPRENATVRPAFDRAVAARDFIEEHVAVGTSLRAIGVMLRIGHDTVRKARAFYLSEDAALDAAAEAVDAA